MADLTRTLVAALAAFDAGAVTVVLALYLRAWRRAPTGYRVKPRHVAEVSLGTLGLIVGIGLAVFDTVGDRALSWRIPGLYLPALVLLAAGIVDVGQLQRQRLAASTSTPKTLGQATRAAEGRHHTAPRPVPPMPTRRAPWWRRWATPALGVLLVALGVFVAVDYTRRADCDDANTAAVQAALQARQAAIEAKYDADRRLVTVLADPQSTATTQRQARVVWLDALARLDAAQALNPAPPDLPRCS